jgi:hypothetical protein
LLLYSIHGKTCKVMRLGPREHRVQALRNVEGNEKKINITVAKSEWKGVLEYKTKLAELNYLVRLRIGQRILHNRNGFLTNEQH